MQIEVLQHVPFEGPGAISDWAAARGFPVRRCRLFTGEKPSEPSPQIFYVIMGGPMNIYEDAKYPWLAEERAFIRRAIAAGSRMIGVCLGAQLLADALGSRVYAGNEKEIGWFPVRFLKENAPEFLSDAPDHTTVFHWHGDTFDIPDRAQHLAQSDACTSQAFLYEKRILALQFHIESTPESVAALVENGADELIDAPCIQSAEEILSAPESTYKSIHAILTGLLDKLIAE